MRPIKAAVMRSDRQMDSLDGDIESFSLFMRRQLRDKSALLGTLEWPDAKTEVRPVTCKRRRRSLNASSSVLFV